MGLEAGLSSYWEECRLSEIADEELATLILNLCIKHGCHEAVRMFQQALNHTMDAKTEWIPVNGIVSVSTIAFANMLPAGEIIRHLRRAEA